MPRETFWHDARVFLTGHTGFKGAWLSLWLERLGAKVTGFALPPPTRPNLYEAAGVEGGLRSIEGDIRDLELLARAVRESEPEIVIHMAAQAIVRESYQDPIATLAVNVLGTAHLLEAVRHSPGVRAVVVVTSDKCYENREWWWAYREKSALGGRDPYSASKGCAELVTRSYRESFFREADGNTPVPVATVRAGNVVGGGDWGPDRVVPDTVRALTGETELRLRYPEAIRPWQFVLEPLSGYLDVAERLVEEGDAFAEAWNFAPNEEDAKPVGWLVDRIHEAWGKPPAWQPAEGRQPHEAIYLRLDAGKAKARLGWRPRLRIEETVDWLVEWYRGVHEGADSRELTLDQIRRYESTGH